MTARSFSKNAASFSLAGRQPVAIAGRSCGDAGGLDVVTRLPVDPDRIARWSPSWSPASIVSTMSTTWCARGVLQCAIFGIVGRDRTRRGGHWSCEG